MNGRGGGGGGGGGGVRRKMVGPPPAIRSKDRDEDLFLFREMHKREKDRVVSLLQPVSDDFEPNGNYALYRMASANNKKGPPGVEFLAESEKNDYDWLKTPPATPLFPSLEMETNAPELVLQREIPIIQPLSRFAGNSEEQKASSGKSKSANPKPKVPLRSLTPSGRPGVLLNAEKKNSKCAPISNQKTNQLSTSDLTKKSDATKSMNQKESHLNFLASNLSKSLLGPDSKTKPQSRGVSPLMRSTVPAQIPGFSDERPPNLKTDRPASASRGRSGNQNQTLTIREKPELTREARRQSCSPSVSRGRKVAPKQESEENVGTQKGRIQTGGNGAQVLGSRMVDKFMNARKSGAEERETKPKLYGLINERSGFGRIISKNSLDVAIKHVETKRDPNNLRQLGTTTGRKSTTK